MRKKREALIPIGVALVTMAAVGHAGHEVDENDCGYQAEILAGSPSSAEVTLNATSPQNITLVWHYEDERSLQSYFRSKSGFSTDFQLRGDRELESIELHSLDCDDISDHYP